MDDAAFLEREFELDGGGLLVRFYTPYKAPGGEFQCRYSVRWPEREIRRYACGLDGVQALMLVMRIVHTELVGSDAYTDGQPKPYPNVPAQIEQWDGPTMSGRRMGGHGGAGAGKAPPKSGPSAFAHLQTFPSEAKQQR